MRVRRMTGTDIKNLASLRPVEEQWCRFSITMWAPGKLEHST